MGRRDRKTNRYVLKGHTLQVDGAVFSPKGQRIVTASRDKTARIWNAQTGQQIGPPLIGHEDYVRSAEFSPDGTRIVTASEDKTVRIWNAETSQQIGPPLIGHTWVSSAKFSPDCKFIVTASYDGGYGFGVLRPVSKLARRSQDILIRFTARSLVPMGRRLPQRRATKPHGYGIRRLITKRRAACWS